MPARPYTPRLARVRDLTEARARIDAELRRLTGAPPAGTAPSHVAGMSLGAARQMARNMVHTGHTHAETAEALGVPVHAVAALIAPPGGGMTTSTPPPAAWRLAVMRGGSGTITHPVIAIAPGCPDERHPTRDCRCRVFRSRAQAEAYVREQEATS